MKALLLTLALLAPIPGAAATADPELVCDPDAKVIFQSRWFQGGSVRLTGDTSGELPWTGHEDVATGQALKNALNPEPPQPEGEEIKAIPDESAFVRFGAALYIEQALTLGQADDGLMIIGSPKVRVYHCRRR